MKDDITFGVGGVILVCARGVKRKIMKRNII